MDVRCYRLMRLVDTEKSGSEEWLGVRVLISGLPGRVYILLPLSLVKDAAVGTIGGRG